MIGIDINCDVGEGVGNEELLLPLISSCNIACGGHAGDRETMQLVVQFAKRHRVRIGAHPSYPDRLNFGRRSMQLSEEALTETVRSQILTLQSVLAKEEASLHHIKPHGALYNDLATNETLSNTFLTAISDFKEAVYLYVPFGSIVQQLARKEGFRIKVEAFADRNYNDDLSLVSRKTVGAVISNPQRVLEHLVQMVKNRQLLTVSGALVHMSADTYCIHGDTENALQIMTYLSEQLPKHHIQIKK